MRLISSQDELFCFNVLASGALHSVGFAPQTPQLSFNPALLSIDMLFDSVSPDVKNGVSPEANQDQNSKYIAVRLRRFADAEIAFSASDQYIQPRKLLASRVDRRDPALRNFSEGLEKCGLQFKVDDCPLYWLLIEDQNSCAYYAAMNEVECVFSAAEFEEFKKSIRYLQGMQYVDKCIERAQHFPIKDQARTIQYSVNR